MSSPWASSLSVTITRPSTPTAPGLHRNAGAGMVARSGMLLVLMMALLPTAALVEMQDGVWAAEGVLKENLSGGGRAFELVPGRKVVVIPLPAGRHARAIAQLAHCATGWHKLYATTAELEEERHNCYRCVPHPRAVRPWLFSSRHPGSVVPICLGLQ